MTVGDLAALGREPFPAGSHGTPTWLGAPERPLAASLHWRPGAPVREGVIIAPPLGHDRVTAHRGLLVLAELLADAGFAVVRFDWTGTGNSAPLLADSATAIWREDMRGVTAWLQAAGAASVSVVGLRSGCLLAAHAAQTWDESDSSLAVADPAARAASAESSAACPWRSLILWDPVGRGREFTRGQRALLANAVPDVDLGPDDVGPGLVLGEPVQQALRALTILPEVLGKILDLTTVLRKGRGSAFDDELRSVSSSCWGYDGAADFLERPSFLARLPRGTLLKLVAGFVAGAPEAGVPFLPHIVTTARIPTSFGDVTEQFVRLPPHGLSGILTTPLAAAVDRGSMLLIQAAAEPLDGPGGLWTEGARRVAQTGITSLRADRRRAGDAGDLEADGDPLLYSTSFKEDSIDAARWLAETTGKAPILAGLCSGGYWALQTAARVPARGVLAIGPLVYETDPDAVPLAEQTLVADGTVAAARTLDHILPTGPRARLKQRMPYSVWRFLARRGRARGVEPLLNAIGCSVPVVLAFASTDWAVFRRQRGPESVATLRRAGRSIVAVEDTALDHSLLTGAARHRALDLLTEIALDGSER